MCFVRSIQLHWSQWGFLRLCAQKSWQQRTSVRQMCGSVITVIASFSPSTLGGMAGQRHLDAHGTDMVEFGGFSVCDRREALKWSLHVCMWQMCTNLPSGPNFFLSQVKLPFLLFLSASPVASCLKTHLSPFFPHNQKWWRLWHQVAKSGLVLDLWNRGRWWASLCVQLKDKETHLSICTQFPPDWDTERVMRTGVAEEWERVRAQEWQLDCQATCSHGNKYSERGSVRKRGKGRELEQKRNDEILQVKTIWLRGLKRGKGTLLCYIKE